jgi:IS1 family transposase
MRRLNCAQIEVNEISGFIDANRKNADRAGAYRDVWTFIALDADSKLIPSFIVGKRDEAHAKPFISGLAGHLQKRVQVSPDSLAAYADAMERGFGTQVRFLTRATAGEVMRPDYSIMHILWHHQTGLKNAFLLWNGGRTITANQ